MSGATLIASANVAYTTGSASIAILPTLLGSPTLAPGHLVMVFMGQSVTGVSYTPPAGWSSATALNTTYSQQFFWTFLTAPVAPGVSFTFVASAAHVGAGVLLAYGGVAGFDLVPTSGNINTTSTTLTATGITANAGDQLVLFAYTRAASASPTAPATITTPTGFTSETSGLSSGSTNADTRITAYDKKIVTAQGATGNITTTISPTNINGGLLVGLTPFSTSVTAPGAEDAISPGQTTVGQAIATAANW